MKTLDRIKNLLEKRGWTIYRLAKNADMSQSTLTNLFNRNYEPTIATLETICKGFGITMSEFFADEEQKVVFSDEQLELLENWSGLSPAQKNAMLLIMNGLSSNQTNKAEGER